jgi:hypothetical protein
MNDLGDVSSVISRNAFARYWPRNIERRRRLYLQSRGWTPSTHLIRSTHTYLIFKFTKVPPYKSPHTAPLPKNIAFQEVSSKMFDQSIPPHPPPGRCFASSCKLNYRPQAKPTAKWNAFFGLDQFAPISSLSRT